MEQTLTAEKQKLLLAIDAVLKTADPGQLRAVAYLRVSTEDQKKGYGITYTGKRVVKHVGKKGWALVDVFADEGFSGSLEADRRPDLRRLMALARQTPRPFDVVVVQEDRAIGRKGRAFWPWVWELEDLGVFTAVVKGDYDNTTDEGRSRMRKAADRAEDELITIRDRTQGGIQEKAEDGGYTGGKVRYGYRIENQGKKGESRLVVDEDGEAAVLRRGRELFVEFNGDRYKTVAQLNAEKLFNRGGSPWNVRVFFSILLDEDRLNAQVIWRKTTRGGKGAKVGPDGQPVYGDTVAIDVPPIFTLEEVEELRNVVRLSKVVRAPATQTAVYTLSNRLLSPCGAAYTGQGWKSKTARYYRCKGKEPAYPGAPVCQCSVIAADPIERRVWQAVSEFLGDARRLEELARKWVGSTAAQKVDYATRIAALDQQIQEQNDIIEATEATAVARAIRRGLSKAEAQKAAEKAVAPLEGALVDLERMRAEAEAWQREAQQVEQRVSSLRALAETAQDRLSHLDAEQQATFLAVLDIKVTVKANPAAGRAGSPCSLIKWFADSGRKVPHLTDEAWAKVQDIAEDRAYRKLSARQILAGLLYKARTGCRWPELPEEYGAHESVKTYWKRWDKTGTWERIMERLADEEGMPAFEDASTVPPLGIRGELFSELVLDPERHAELAYRSASVRPSS
ncbi:recombinase family protein [Streptomyces sp. NPDC002928]|uniref:recombinase family protein n=1 Tax=Streptomyces sp. NPDC002928 TaxID=3154440 RepID=UPI0033AE3A21